MLNRTTIMKMPASTLSAVTFLLLLPQRSSHLAPVLLTLSPTTVLLTASVRARLVLTLAVLVLPALPTPISLPKFMVSCVW